jgi:hypothetical protein
MIKKFFYTKLKFTPKDENRTAPAERSREVVVEVPRDRAQRQESEIIDENLRKVLALDLARKAALGTFPTAEQGIEMYEEDSPTWHDERLEVMNERPCDHEEDGARAWRIN